MAQPRKAPLHLPIAVGLTTGLYAVSLAGVTALQAQTDGAAVAAQQPSADAIRGLAAQRAALERDLAQTAAALNRAGTLYNGSLAKAAGLRTAVTALAREVQAATGAAAHVPSGGSLPTAVRAVTAAAPAPVAHATTGGSTVVK